MTTYFKDTQLAKHLGIGRATIWRWIKEGRFPPPVRFSENCVRWASDDIDKWLADRKKK